MDQFLATSTGQAERGGDPAQKVYSDRLYRSELARDEAQAKLEEW